jgi:hypothetical protein
MRDSCGRAEEGGITRHSIDFDGADRNRDIDCRWLKRGSRNGHEDGGSTECKAISRRTGRVSIKRVQLMAGGIR